MQLKKIEIEKERWGKDEGKYKATIAFEDIGGEISLKLSPESSSAFLLAVSDTLKSFALQAQAELITIIDAACKDAASARQESHETKI